MGPTNPLIVYLAPGMFERPVADMPHKVALALQSICLILQREFDVFELPDGEEDDIWADFKEHLDLVLSDIDHLEESEDDYIDVFPQLEQLVLAEVTRIELGELFVRNKAEVPRTELKNKLQELRDSSARLVAASAHEFAQNAASCVAVAHEKHAAVHQACEQADAAWFSERPSLLGLPYEEFCAVRTSVQQMPETVEADEDEDDEESAA